MGPEAEGRWQSLGLGEILSRDMWDTKLAGSPGEL